MEMFRRLLLITGIVGVFSKILPESGFHMQLNEDELAMTFGVDKHGDVPKYEGVKVHGLRVPINRDGAEHSLSLRAFGRGLNIKTKINNKLLAESHTTEFVDAQGRFSKFNGHLGVFTAGTVQDEPHSHVSLHHSAKGVSGSIRMANDLYLIHPLPARLQDGEADHLIFRASDVPGNHIQPFSAAEDAAYKLHKRNRRSVSTGNRQKKTLELLIAADWKMLEKYGAEFLPTYMLHVTNVMASFFADSSLAYPIDVVIVRSVIFQTDILQAPDISGLLSKFSDWCNAHNNNDDTAVEHFDHALLLTKNGCADGCSLDGLAYAGVPCNFGKAQGVAKDRGFVSALTLAHELGHNLKASHDTSDACPNGINIMSSGGIAGGPEAFRWSSCTSKTFEDIMVSSAYTCYDDAAATNISDTSFQLYGTMYDATTQCKYMLGNEYQKCGPYAHRCDKLFCNKIGTNTCDTLYYPALHGTSCGDRMWCIHGNCVPDGSAPPTAVDGGWSAWSEFTACSKSCNVGVQWKTRTCTNPVPAHGGKQCDASLDEGEAQKGSERTCNLQLCAGTNSVEERYGPDRDLQCGALKENSTFCSYCSGIGPCSLYCGGPTYGTLSGYTKDGTYCNVNNAHGGVCLAGACVEIGCDYNLHSGHQIDRCGVCNGDGSSCQPVTGQDLTKHKTNGQRGHFFIVTIPVGAKDTLVQELALSKNFITCKVGDSNAWAIPFPSYGKEVQLDGALIRYKLTSFPHADKLYIDGTLKVPVHVYYSNYHYYDNSPGLTWTYTMTGITPTGTVQVYWNPDDWSVCSQTCAGGIMTRDIHCSRKDDNTSATVELCNTLADVKPATQASCQTQNCPPAWHISEWSTCSQSCATGTQTKTVTCAEQTHVGTYTTVADSLCTTTKPEATLTQNCNDVTCTAYWKAGEFSTCSATCGGGIKSREISCMRLDRNNKLLTVNQLECSGKNESGKPAQTQTCNTVACPSWDIELTDCSESCGAGV